MKTKINENYGYHKTNNKTNNSAEYPIIKQIPSDFIVIEIPSEEIITSIQSNKTKGGKYTLFLLKKENIDHFTALKMLSQAYKKPLNSIGYAGIKDKRAITYQYCSLKGWIENIKQTNSSKSLNDSETISSYLVKKHISINSYGHSLKEKPLKAIETYRLAKSNKPISMGNLKENLFVIRIRNLNSKSNPAKTLKSIYYSMTNNNKQQLNIIFPNYFDTQRFGIYMDNAIIGKLIIKKEYEKALNIIIKNLSPSNLKDKLTTSDSVITKLKLIPKKHLSLYIHAYQSLLFNKTLSELIKIAFNLEHYQTIDNFIFFKKALYDKQNEALQRLQELPLMLPIIGYGLNSEIEHLKRYQDKYYNIKGIKLVEKIIKKITEKEGIAPKDFVIHSIPEISGESLLRKSIIQTKVTVTDIGKDKLNRNRTSARVIFRLPKGSYATMLIKSLLLSRIKIPQHIEPQ
ncbi:MAG: tRNA pseudouridine(13) synthase TruD [Nitrospiraceae bacterium]|nr:tRNA pseudouridine(13) synthase TruD [Nitrospiraceae bacterium]